MKKITLLLLLLNFQLLLANPLNLLRQEFKDFRTYPRIDRAYQFIQKGENKKAKTLLKEVLKIDNKNKKAKKLLVELCIEENDTKCTEQYLPYASPLHLGYYHQKKAQKALKEKDYKITIKEATESLNYKLSPKDKYFTKVMLFEAYLAEGKFQKANKLIEKKSLSINELFNWSKKSDNLGYSNYALNLAKELPPIEKYIKWRLNLSIKEKNYKQASKEMALLYKIDPSKENEEQFNYLYEVSNQKGNILQHYEEKLKKGCDKHALEFLLESYKENQAKRAKLLDATYPFACLSKKKQLNATLLLIDYLKKTNLSKAKRLAKEVAPKVHNQQQRFYLYDLAGDHTYQKKFYQKRLQKGCNKKALTFLLNKSKKSQRTKLLQKHYPFSCLPKQKANALKIELLTKIKKKEPQRVNEILATLKISKVNPKHYLYLSNLYASLGQYNKSAIYNNAYLNKHPKSFKALKNMGYASLKLNQKEQALDYFMQAIKIVPNDEEVLKNIGYLATDLKKYNLAINAWESYLKNMMTQT